MSNKLFLFIFLLVTTYFNGAAQDAYKLHGSPNCIVQYYDKNSKNWEITKPETILYEQSLIKASEEFEITNVYNKDIHYCRPSNGEKLMDLITHKTNRKEGGAFTRKSGENDLLITNKDFTTKRKYNFHYFCAYVNMFSDPHWKALKDFSEGIEQLSSAIQESTIPLNGYYLGYHNNLYGSNQTTSHEIKKCFQALTDSVNYLNNGTDLVFLFLSGHGEKDKSGQFHFITTDSQYDSINTDYQNSISSRELIEMINNISQKGAIVLVFIDACFSGAILQEANTIKGNVALYLSTDKDLYAYETYKEGSPFTQAIINSLTGNEDALGYYNDLNEKIVSPFFLESYIHRYVQKRSPLQNPIYYLTNIRPEAQLWELYDKTNEIMSKNLWKAEEGDTQALINLGDAYYYGTPDRALINKMAEDFSVISILSNKVDSPDVDSIPIDFNKAFSYYQQAYKKGSALAEAKLGLCYFYGNGITPADKSKALQYFTEAAQQHVNLANYYLGVCYSKGIGVTKDMKKAKTYLKQVTKLDADIKHAFGIEGVKCKVRDKYGDSWLENFDGVPGIVKARRSNGVDTKMMYDKPDVFILDLEAAAVFFEDADCQAFVGDVYRYGLFGRKINPQQSLHMYNESAKKNNKYGLFGLARCYEDGFGVEKDITQALQYLKQSINKGLAYGYTYLGDSYFKGTLGLKRNEREAVSNWKIAAEKGDRIGQYKYGVCYQLGKQVNVDEVQAFKWFKKSADQGYDEAQYKVGLCYLYGIGTKKNVNKAYTWLQKASSQKQQDAIKVLDTLFNVDGSLKQNVSLTM